LVPRRRVFVTGIGWMTPHGDDVAAGFARLCAGESAVRRDPIPGWPEAAGPLLARARWDPRALTPAQTMTMDPVAQMGVLAGSRALAQAGLAPHDPALVAAGVYVGCGLGGGSSLDEGFARYYARQLRTARPTSVARIMPNATAGHLSMAFGITGPNHTYSVACASSAAALGEAFRAIRDGYLECAVAGGAEAMITHPILIAWAAAGVLAREHPDGAAASVRPFDAARTGFVLGEGAAMLVLESEQQVARRGAEPLGEIVGYGASADASHLTQPLAEGQVRAMRAALADAGLPPEAVGYVNAHATATPVGDPLELEAIRQTFGAHAPALAISATKSMHGHLIGAAGALELAITLLAVQRGQLPPTANLDTPDVGTDLDLVPRTGRAAAGVEVALSNSFAFGGANVSLIVRRVVG
jgi:3-oxoacyl-[acyl-carrier-protein] synthase II